MERFTLSESMVASLRAIQAKQLARYDDPVLRNHDAVVATYGLGPAMYLCLDGRVLILDHDEVEPALLETTDEFDLRTASVVIANRYCVPDLLTGELFPPRPPGANECRLCCGDRWVRNGIVCPVCRALGWIAEENPSS